MIQCAKALVVVLGICSLTAFSHAEDLQAEPQVRSSEATAGVAVDQTSSVAGLVVGNGMKVTSSQKDVYASGGYFAFFEKSGSGWVLVDISGKRKPITDFSKQEVLFFSKDLKFVQPDYRDYLADEKGGSMQCWTGALRSSADNRTRDYNPCDSTLTSVSNLNVGSNIFNAVFTLGLSVAAGTSTRSVSVDKDKLLALIQQTDALNLVREKVQGIEKNNFVASYRAAFSSATTPSQFESFAKKYEGNDPERLVPLAINRRDQLIQKEEEERPLRLAEEARRQELQEKRIADLAARAERIAVANRAAVSKIGAHVCRMETGVTDIAPGERRSREFQIEGYVDAANLDLIKITVTSIAAPRLFGQKGLDSLSELPPKYTKGLFLWAKTSEWRPC